MGHPPPHLTLKNRAGPAPYPGRSGRKPPEGALEMTELLKAGMTGETYRPLTEAEFAALGAPVMVYVRPLTAETLIAEIPEARSEIDAGGVYYALHGADGRRLAVFANRDEALAVAFANDAEPVSLH